MHSDDKLRAIFIGMIGLVMVVFVVGASATEILKAKYKCEELHK